MALVTWFIDFILHLDRHLTDLVAMYQYWVYAILFLIVFAETGFVVTPFLPGDSLLFAVGALAAVDQTGTLNPAYVWILLIVAEFLGNELNYLVGRYLGPRAFTGKIPGLKREYLLKTQAFYDKHGRKTIVLSRFLPIIRTFAPFVAGIGHMRRTTFSSYNIGGAVAWVTIFIWGGFLFGNVPIIKNNFGVVTIAIIVISLLPLAWGLLQSRRSS